MLCLVIAKNSKATSIFKVTELQNQNSVYVKTNQYLFFENKRVDKVKSGDLNVSVNVQFVYVMSLIFD